jgi:hypothetical protein
MECFVFRFLRQKKKKEKKREMSKHTVGRVWLCTSALCILVTGVCGVFFVGLVLVCL